MKESISIIEMFEVIGFKKEDIDLTNPELVWKIIENSSDSMAYFGLIIASHKR